MSKALGLYHLEARGGTAQGWVLVAEWLNLQLTAIHARQDTAMKVLAKLGVIFDSTNNVLASISGILVIILMLFTCYMVMMRYLFQSPPPWGMEISEYMLFVLPMLGAAWLLKRQGHVRVDIVINRLNPKIRTVLNIVTSAIGAGVCLIVTWYGVAATLKHFQEGIVMLEFLSVPKFILLAFIPFACLLLSLEFLRQGYNYLMSLRTS